jgi:tetratricopeptide (TPR) repeat protein
LLTEVQEREAQTQRRRAEAHFRRAIHGVTSLLLRLEERRWAGMPEIGELRQALAEEGVKVLQGFLCECSCDPAVRAETGRAYVVLAGVYAMRSANSKALDAYRKAITLFDRLAAEFPHDPEYKHNLGLSRNMLAIFLHQIGRPGPARREFRRAVALYRQVLAAKSDVRSLNDLAWLLATCPFPEFRNPTEAVALARRAVQLGECGELWNTLGVAYYRVGKWKAAVGALQQSMRMRSGGDSSDWFFLAMAYWQLGEKRKAHHWFDRALQDVQKTSLFEPLGRYREEAEALLGRKISKRSKDRG